jgi:hypothetical protein
MAHQKGPLKVKGTLGDLTFYKSQDGYLIREKGGIDKKKIKNDPAFKRTQENGSEFGRAGKAGKLLRTAFRTLLLNADNRVVSRLHSHMMAVIKTDAVSARGLRNVTQGNVGLLTDFEFNNRAPLGSAFFAPYNAAIDRATGEFTVSIPPFNPSAVIMAPPGCTHYKIVSGAAAIDFENKEFVMDASETAILPWNAVATVAVAHTNVLVAAGTDPQFLLLGLEFYQEVNGEKYPLTNGAFNGAALVKVSKV